MSLTTQAQTTSNNSQNTDVDVIVTSSGGEDMPRAAYRGGALVGMNSSEDAPPSEIPVSFVDWPFLEDDFSFQDHLDEVKHYNPKYAVAPDIENPEEIHHRLDQADRLKNHAENVIVVPKGIKPNRVPSKFRVGLPAQDRFGGVPHPVWEYRGCDSIHILGGSPKRQQKLSDHLGQVDSVDTASPLKAAMFGDVWDGSWCEQGQNYYDRIEISMTNLVYHWNDEVDEDWINLRRLKVEQPEKCLLPDDRKANPRSKAELCLSNKEEVPFPGREYFYRDDTLSHQEWTEKYR